MYTIKDTEFSSYEELQSWLLDEIGDISIDTIQQHQLPKSFEFVANLSEKEANLVLKKAYIDNFMSRRDYDKQIKFLSQINPRRTRLKIRSSLPSTDFAILLKSVPGITYLQRAASLTYAAVCLHLKFQTGDLSTSLSQESYRSNCSIYNNVFAASIFPRIQDSYIHLNKNSTYINILFKGVPYTLQVIQNGEAVSPGSIFNALRRLLEEAGNARSGAIGLLRSAPLDLVSRKYQELRSDAFDILHGAIFTLCIDDDHTYKQGSSRLNHLFTAIFSGGRHNRWYGGTQVVVRPDGESALFFSYMCGVDGVQANEVANEISNNSQEINWNRTEVELPQLSVNYVGLLIDNRTLEELERASDPLFHEEPSVYTLPLGLNYFRDIELSPNIAIHFLLMLAFKDAGELNFLPETSQAIVVRDQLWGGVQLDWLRARPEIIRSFLRQKNNLSLFRQAIVEHKSLIRRSRESLSPFLFFDNSLEGRKDELIRFYLSLGQEEALGAYRHYLCPITRDPAALDIITSSLRLWDGIELIGRPGTRSELVNMAGTHILFEDEETHIVFTPTKEWEGKLSLVIEHMLKWMGYLSDLSETRSQ